MQLPTVPSFSTGDTSITKLQQLSNAVSFLAVAQSGVMWHFYANSQQGAFSGSWVPLIFANVALDTDGVWNAAANGIATIVTQGYYAVEMCLPVETAVTTFTIRAGFLWTAGANNPHFSVGTTRKYGVRSGATNPQLSTNETLCVSDLIDVVCYPGDTITPRIFTSSSCTIDFNSALSVTKGRFVTNFTGHLVCLGT
jgi:hypothetical protein